MKRRIFRLMAVAVMLIGMGVLLAPSVGQAITISSVVVDINGTLFNIWTYPIALAPGESALLSQTSGYNFDGSDLCFSPIVCGAPTITVTTDAGVFVYTDATNKLTAAPVVDSASDPPLETQEYVQATGGSALLALFVGYADDAHLQSPHTACTDPGGDCRPNPFTASAGANHFQAVPFAGGPTACLGSVSPCIDAGVLRFVAADVPNVPEPSTLLLLGAGLVGLAAWGRKRMQS